MTRLEKSAEIKATPEEVFAFMISEKMNDYVWGKWVVGKWTTPGPVGVGSIGHWTAKPDNTLMKGEWDTKVTEFVKNKKMAMESVEGSKFKMAVMGLFESSSIGTKVTYIEDYEVPYSVLGKLVDRIKYRKETEKLMETWLLNLKKALEA